MNFKWNYEQPTPEREQQAKELADKIGMSPIMAELLFQRGIRTESAAKRFFRPMLSELIDPFLMNDMDVAVKLIIVLDCGIKAVDEIAYAKSLGIDFIVCDHHVPDDELPNAVAILNPKRKDYTYPFKELCGCGVGFKFMQAFAKNNGIPFSQLIPLLDFCAVSIAADIVSIMGENRILAFHGLKQLNQNPSIGMKAIIETCD